MLWFRTFPLSLVKWGARIIGLKSPPSVSFSCCCCCRHMMKLQIWSLSRRGHVLEMEIDDLTLINLSLLGTRSYSLGGDRVIRDCRRQKYINESAFPIERMFSKTCRNPLRPIFSLIIDPCKWNFGNAPRGFEFIEDDRRWQGMLPFSDLFPDTAVEVSQELSFPVMSEGIFWFYPYRVSSKDQKFLNCRKPL